LIAIFVSVTTAGFHVILIPVPVEPLRNSPPFGERMVARETAGLIESIVKPIVPVAVFPSLSVAIIRVSALEVLTHGTIQETLPLFPLLVRSAVQVAPESVE
jgi:hypothetical protein